MLGGLKAAVAAAAMAAAFAPAARASEAPSSYQVSYIFTSQYQVSNLNIFNGDNQATGSIDYGFGDAYPNTPQTITSSTQTLPVGSDRSFIFGVAQDLPGDAAGQQHLVLFTNSNFAQSAAGVAFGTLFPNTNEGALISYLQGNPTSDGSSPTFNFAFGDAQNGPNGDLAFNPGSDFTEIAFSNGQLIGVGNGSSVVTPQAGGGGGGGPEPSTWALMMVGVFGAGFALRRASASAGRASHGVLSA